MLKNLSDYLTFATLLLMNIIIIPYSLGRMFSAEHDSSFAQNVELLRHYDDNEEE